MPKMGESVAEATITQWLKNEGDTIALDESVLTIATDKVDSDIPSPVAGVLVKRLFNENDVIQVGQVIAHIQTEGDAPVAAPVKTEAPAPVQEKPVPQAPADASPASSAAAIEASAEAVKSSTGPIPRESNGRFYSPLVRSIAEAEGISEAELNSIDGSGNEGRVTKSDVLAFLQNRAARPDIASIPAPTATSTPAAPAASSGGASVAGHGFEAPAPTVSRATNW